MDYFSDIVSAHVRQRISQDFLTKSRKNSGQRDFDWITMAKDQTNDKTLFMKLKIWVLFIIGKNGNEYIIFSYLRRRFDVNNFIPSNVYQIVAL